MFLSFVCLFFIILQLSAISTLCDYKGLLSSLFLDFLLCSIASAIVLAQRCFHTCLNRPPLSFLFFSPPFFLSYLYSLITSWLPCIKDKRFQCAMRTRNDKRLSRKKREKVDHGSFIFII